MTPSQQIINDSNPTEDIKDAKGRVLQVRRTTTLERRRMTRAGGQAADIDRWFGEAFIAVQVRAIDGVPVPFPATSDAIDQLVDRLGDDGLVATMEWLQRGAEVPQPDPQTSPTTST